MLFCLVLCHLVTKNRKSFGSSGDRSSEEARSLPLIGTCEDSRCFAGKAYIVHALSPPWQWVATHVRRSSHCADQIFTDIKEDARQHPHIIERLFEEANIEISALGTDLEYVKKSGVGRHCTHEHRAC